jgi:hypothetical protein
VYIRLFRHSRHLYKHSILGWTVWIALCVIAVGIAFVFSISVPIFTYLIGIAASLFASWYTYGIAGFFWLHDTYYLKGGSKGLRKHGFGTVIAILTILAGAFICVAGTYISIKVRIQFVPISIYVVTHLVNSAYQ